MPAATRQVTARPACRPPRGLPATKRGGRQPPLTNCVEVAVSAPTQNAATLTALHGDTWHSPRWAVAIDGTPTALSSWHVRAQARATTEAETATFEWTVDGGGIILGTATVKLSSGVEITTSTVQLQLRPADWVGKPRRWSGVLDVELNSDTSPTPAERRTVIASRRFIVNSDVAR